MTEVTSTQAGLNENGGAAVRKAHRWRIILVSVLIGAVIAWLWSFRIVDSVIGDNVANTLLGYDAKKAPIDGAVAGAIFAFVSGLAGTFTACNVAVFGTVTPMMGEDPGARKGFWEGVRPLGWLVVGMLTVSAVYGALGAMLGDSLPQLSTAVVGSGFPVRLIQSSIVFGLIGLSFVYLGLAALDIVPDPFGKLARRHPNARLVFIGALVGAFLIGRPFPLFFKLFGYAAESHNPLYGALVFVLQSLGNIAIMAVVFLLLFWLAGPRYQRWMASKPGRSAVVAASAFIIAGSFTFLYWDMRVPSLFGVGWYPMAPWS